jgi:hypothetical protein
VATFLLPKVRPRPWWETEKAKRSTRLAVVVWLFMLLALIVLMQVGHVSGI